jgi:hypothetical protein
MTGLAVHIDGSVDFWILRQPLSVEVRAARMMVNWIGANVLVGQNTEQGGVYLGIARLVSIAISSADDSHDLIFDRVRAFAVPQPDAGGIVMGARLRFIDDRDFDSLVRLGRPADTPPDTLAGFRANPPRPQLDETAVALIGGVKPPERCAFTGEKLRAGTGWTVVSPRRAAAGLAENILAFSAAAQDAFLDGHFSARDDLTILVDMTRMEPSLFRRMNPTKRLLVPDDSKFRPSASSLADHRRFSFRLY